MRNAEEILKYLHGTFPVVLELRETVTSTNTMLKELAEQGAAEGTVFIAEEQTAGKGRLGRSFSSPKGTGLYMSILLRPKAATQDALLITTAAAVAVARAIEQTTGKIAQIKWVNDIYVNTYKVCGILAESAIDAKKGELRYVVLGIGVNLQQPEHGFSQEIREVAGVLYQNEMPKYLAEHLAAQILNEFFRFYEHLTEKAFLEEYRSRSLLTGISIRFSKGEEFKNGTVLGIDEEAHLVVRLTDGTIESFSMGEIIVEKDFLEQLRKEPVKP